MWSKTKKEQNIINILSTREGSSCCFVNSAKIPDIRAVFKLDSVESNQVITLVLVLV